MKPYKFIVGEDVDLPEDFVKKNDIGIFKYSIILNDQSYAKDELYKEMRRNKIAGIAEYPKTSQPSTGTFTEILEDALKEYERIILITISSDLSGTYNAASQAVSSLSDEYKKRIMLIDSRNGSVSEAVIVLHMIKYCNRTNSTENIRKEFERIIPKARLITTIDDPMWLEAGGRISKIKAIIMRQMMKVGVRPILSVNEGKVELLKIKTNVKEKTDALFYQFRDEVETTHDRSTIHVVISHGDNKKQAELLRKKITTYDKEIIIEFESCCSAVFGAHLGPDCILLGWIVG